MTFTKNNPEDNCVSTDGDDHDDAESQGPNGIHDSLFCRDFHHWILVLLTVRSQETRTPTTDNSYIDDLNLDSEYI